MDLTGGTGGFAGQEVGRYAGASVPLHSSALQTDVLRGYDGFLSGVDILGHPVVADAAEVPGRAGGATGSTADDGATGASGGSGIAAATGAPGGSGIAATVGGCRGPNGGNPASAVTEGVTDPGVAGTVTPAGLSSSGSRSSAPICISLLINAV